MILVLHSFTPIISVSPASTKNEGYFQPTALSHLAVAEEALSLTATQRVELAKLLIRSLEGEGRTDEEVKADLTM